MGRSALFATAQHGRPGGSALVSSSESRRRGGAVVQWFLLPKVEGAEGLFYDQPPFSSSTGCHIYQLPSGSSESGGRQWFLILKVGGAEGVFYD